MSVALVPAEGEPMAKMITPSKTAWGISQSVRTCLLPDEDTVLVQLVCTRQPDSCVSVRRTQANASPGVPMGIPASDAT